MQPGSLLFVGRATSFAIHDGHAQEYDAEIVFGISTDTADASGRVRAKNDSSPKSYCLRSSVLSATLNRFRHGFCGRKGSAFTNLLAKGSQLSRQACDNIESALISARLARV